MKQQDTLFFDGAFGTYYQQLTGCSTMCELANLHDPQTVLAIHKEYLNAGAQAIKTNTFGANPTTLPDEAQLEQVLAKGLMLASQAAEGRAQVFADIGNITASDTALLSSEQYVKVATLFLKHGATRFLFETIDAFEPLVPAITFIRKANPNVTIAVSFAVSQDGYSAAGCYYKDLLESAWRQGADIVGLNCVCGPSHIYHLLKDADLRGMTLSAMPNAGYPVRINSRQVYRDNPSYFAHKLQEMHELGVTVFGGCCGTTPEHIAAAVCALKHSGETQNTTAVAKPRVHDANVSTSYLAQKMQAEQKPILVEIDPPVDTDADFFMQAAHKLKQAGADCITIADSPLARARANSMMLAAKLKRELNIDVLPHVSCRDANRIAIQGSLLAGNLEGVQNILAITGDPVVATGHVGSAQSDKNVFNFNSYGLISFINSLNQTMFASSPYLIAGALNVNATAFDKELLRAQKKVENGAAFLLTQAIFTSQSIQNLRLAKATLNCKVFAGIMPVASFRNAVFLSNEVPGFHLPQTFLQSLEGKSTQDVTALTIAFCCSLIDQVTDCCDGYYLMTPLKRVDLTVKLVQYLKQLGR